MKNLLISGLGGSLFPYFHNKLIENGYKPHYVDSNYELKFIYPDVQFFPAPPVTEESYFDFIKDLCVEKNIGVYIPLIDEEILTAHKIAKQIGNLTVLAPTSDFTELCLNKYALMKKLQETGISNNQTYLGSEFKWQIEPPVFVKPNSGRGSRGIRKINNDKELSAYYILDDYKPNEIIIQSFINGVEYTVGVVANKKNKIISISPKRIIQKRGITISSVTENNSVIEEAAHKINDELQPQGPFNIQLFLTEDNIPVVFEINPRFSTTSIQTYESGINEIDLYLNHYEDSNVTLSRGKEKIFMYRRWHSEFYTK